MEFQSANGVTILIDGQDYQFVCPYQWKVYRYSRSKQYATTDINGKTIYMHRLLMNSKKGEEVDHKNGNGIDNRRTTNLRRATHAQNLANQLPNNTNTSGYPGVTYAKRRKHLKTPWAAQSKHKGKHIHLGYYETPELAAAARRVWYGQMHGQFAPSSERTSIASTSRVS